MEDQVEPRLLGVLVTYRRPEDLAVSLDRLRAQTRPLDRLLVVDNASDPLTRGIVERSGAEYIDAGDNLGPAGGYAMGMTELMAEASDNDWVLLFDDDDPPFFDDALAATVRFALQMVRQHPMVGGVGISGGRFDFGSGRVRRIGDSEIHGTVQVDHITGGGLPAYRVGAIHQVGVFLAELFFGFEELEYGLRLSRAGHPLFADGEQWMRRKKMKREAGLLPAEEVSVARSTNRNVGVTDPSWRRYYSMRNMIFLLRMYDASGAALKIALIRGVLKPVANLITKPRLAWSNLALNWRAIRDGWTGRMGRTVTPVDSAGLEPDASSR